VQLEPAIWQPALLCELGVSLAMGAGLAGDRHPSPLIPQRTLPNRIQPHLDTAASSAFAACCTRGAMPLAIPPVPTNPQRSVLAG
jgi:hypothetical protein